MTHNSLIKVKVLYTNWKGETRAREIIPVRLWYGSTKWHPEDQYLLEAVDCEDNRSKDFALLGLKGEPH